MSENGPRQQPAPVADPAENTAQEVNQVDQAVADTPAEPAEKKPSQPSEPKSRRQNGKVKNNVGEEVQHTRIRLLCPLGMAGGLIGKKGESIMKIRRDTNTQVAVEDYVAGSEDRVVSIIADRGQPGSESSSGEDALCSVFDRMCSLAEGRRRPAAASRAASISQPETNGHSSDAGESDVSSAAAAAGSVGSPQLLASCRLLVDSSQIGYLVGKGGATIKSTVAQSGASIRILPKAELPPCACVTDEIVLVTGDTEQVKSALRLLGAQLGRHPPRMPPAGTPPLLLGHASHPDLSLYHGVYGAPGTMAGAMHAMSPAGAMQSPLAMYGGAGMQPVDVSFRLLVPVGKAGNIIGRSGEHIKRIRAETGARIKMHDPAGESEERLVSVMSSEEAMAPYCAAQDALIRCAISLTSDDAPNGSHRVRLLTSQASVGVVLGKKGHTVTQLRAETGAAIKVLPADGLQDEDSPDEVVQVEGNMQQCISALRGVATLLRGWQIRQHARASMSLTPSSSPPPGGVMSQQGGIMPQPVPLSPGGMLTPQHHASGMLPPPPPGSPGMVYTYGNALPSGSVLASPGGRHHGMGSPHASFRYSLNQLQVGAVIGRQGAHIMQIRQMSGARVQLPGEADDKGERKLEISGTPEQCQAAHHLVNSYLAVGRAPPAFPTMA